MQKPNADMNIGRETEASRLMSMILHFWDQRQFASELSTHRFVPNPGHKTAYGLPLFRALLGVSLSHPRRRWRSDPRVCARGEKQPNPFDGDSCLRGKVVNRKHIVGGGKLRETEVENRRLISLNKPMPIGYLIGPLAKGNARHPSGAGKSSGSTTEGSLKNFSSETVQMMESSRRPKRKRFWVKSLHGVLRYLMIERLPSRHFDPSPRISWNRPVIEWQKSWD